jgi:phosphatidylglycerol:prolipoprotein diacylglycerol transferase
MSINGLIMLGLLVLLYRRKRFHGRIICAYVILYATTRFFIERVRGDADRGFVLGGLLSTSQLLSIVLAILALAAYVALARRHRLLGEPDWSPAR